jgi:PAS domain S-box-containing protein
MRKLGLKMETEKIWQQVYEHSPIGITIVSVAGKFVNPNQTLCKILGRSREELESCTWQQITHPDDLLIDKELVLDVLVGRREGYQLQKRYYRGDGSICHATLLVGCDRDEWGKVNYFISQILDNGEDEEVKKAERQKWVNYEAFKESVLKGVNEDQFVLHYQEIIELKTLKVSGYEALIRWNHPEQGFIYPDKFIEEIERNPELMFKLCEWVFLKAIDDKKRLDGFLSINISPVSLLHPEFIEMVALCDNPRDQPVIYLEITERLALDRLSGDDRLKVIAECGYGVFVDDFGQGHSGLIQVIRLLNAFRNRASIKVKIDIWFTERIMDESVSYAMEGLIMMIHGLGIEVIAEGVETEEQLAAWQAIGCDYCQGWLFGRAAAIPDLAQSK